MNNQKSDNESFIVEKVNLRIRQEVCQETIDELSDIKLLNDFMKCKSVKQKILSFKEKMETYNLQEDDKLKIQQDVIFDFLIPPGTKGVIRGNKFNIAVKQAIDNLNLDTDRFEVQFEKESEVHRTSEIPDWYIIEKSSNKIIIGMNQIDLWSGGHQINRGSKYLMNNLHNTQTSKLLCVICKYKQFSSTTMQNKAFNLFQVGFESDTLCYLGNLKQIIYKFFNINEIN